MPSRLAKVVLGVLAALLLAAAGAVSYVSYRAGQSLLHPARETVDATPESVGVEWAPAAFATSDGVALQAWWIPADATPEDNRTVVFLHGYGESREQALPLLPFLHRAGYNALAFDHRAHGASGGDYTTVGVLERRDVYAAVDWLASRPGFPEDPDVALLGWSMGGATAILAGVHEHRVDAIVADSAFTRVAAVAGAGVERYTGLPPWPFGPLAVRFAAWSVGVDIAAASPVESAKELRTPLLLVHGGADSFIPHDHSDLIADAYGGGHTSVLRFPGAEHVGSHASDPARYESEVLRFLDAAFARLLAEG